MILRPEIAPFWNAAVASFVWQDSGHTNSVVIRECGRHVCSIAGASGQRF